MSKPLDNNLIKKPHQTTSWTEQQIMEIAQCCDPVTGPHYFCSNFFYIQHPTKGKLLYQPFDYQLRTLNTMHNFRFSVTLQPRQTGKSTTAAGYLLWFAMFNPDCTVLIAAHKYLGAQEIMQRIRYAYENTPDHIRAGVTSYNKGSIEFENGSRIVSQTTTETTGRGMSVSLLYCLGGDTTVTVRNKKTEIVSKISLSELYTALSGYFMFAENQQYEILTPTGWQDFRGITQTEDKELVRVTLKNNISVDATINHYFFKENQKVQLSELVPGDRIDTIDGPVEIATIEVIGKDVVYDVIEVSDKKHLFIVNDSIITKNCDEFAYVRPTVAREFWVSISPTLSTGGKAIITSTPNSDEDQFATIWKQANKCVDEWGNPTEVGVNGFKAVRSYWNEHPDRDEKWKQEEIGRIGEERFRREHECITGDSKISIKWPNGEIQKVTIEELKNLLSL
jgi:hypothetical protein